MAKRNALIKKKLMFAGAEPAAPALVVSGRQRESISPGLSRKAVDKIERYEAASQRAEQRLGNIRLG